MTSSTRVEQLGGGVALCVSKAHSFGTDAFLLSRFAAPRPGQRCCDLGSGCGIVGLLWFCRPQTTPAHLDMVELQEEAAALARASLSRSGLEAQARVYQADLRQLPQALPRGGYHLVSCNPPYKASGSGIPSSGESGRLARHETACTIGDVCRAAAGLLRYGGRLCVCQRPERLPDVLQAMRAHRLEPKRLRFVHKDAACAPWLFLAEARLGGRPFLQVEPPLIQYQNGVYTPEMEAHYELYRKN